MALAVSSIFNGSAYGNFGLIIFSVSYRITGRQEFHLNAVFEYKLHRLNLSADHLQTLQLNPAFVPRPEVNERLSYSFRLELHYLIL